MIPSLDSDAIDSFRRGEKGVLYEDYMVSPDRWDDYCPPAGYSNFLVTSAVYHPTTYKELIYYYGISAIESIKHKCKPPYGIVLGLPIHLYMREDRWKFQELFYNAGISNGERIHAVGCVPSAFAALACREKAEFNQCVLYVNEGTAFTEAVLLQGGKILWWGVLEYERKRMDSSDSFNARYSDSYGKYSGIEGSWANHWARFWESALKAVDFFNVALSQIISVNVSLEMNVSEKLKDVKITHVSAFALCKHLSHIADNELQMRKALKEAKEFIRYSCPGMWGFKREIFNYAAELYYDHVSYKLLHEPNLYNITKSADMLFYKNDEACDKIAEFAVKIYERHRKTYVLETAKYVKECFGHINCFDYLPKELPLSENDICIRAIADYFRNTKLYFHSEETMSKYMSSFWETLDFGIFKKYTYEDRVRFYKKWTEHKTKIIETARHYLYEQADDEKMLSPLIDYVSEMDFKNLCSVMDDLSLICYESQ